MTVTKEDVKYAVDIIVQLHKSIITLSGGEQGIRDEGGLEHAITKLLTFGSKLNINPFAEAAEIYKLFATRHYFVDGNKRTSHLVAKVYLQSYQYRFRPSYEEAVKFIIDIGAGKKTTKQIEKWLKANSVKGDIANDELQKDILDMLNYSTRKD